MITVALIGAGRWGVQYIKEIGSIKEFSLQYICSPHIDSKQAIPQTYIRVKDYYELLSKKIDAIIIATPAITHFSIASQFLQKGFNVLIEKPLTTNYHEALKLKKIAEKQKSIVMVGHLYHYNNAFQKTKELLPKVGQISSIYTEAGKFWPDRTDASALWEWAPHDVAMSLELMQSMPQYAAAWATWRGNKSRNIHDMVYIHLKFLKKVDVFIRAGWSFPKKTRELTIFGSTAMIRYDELQKKKISFVRYDNNKKERFSDFSTSSPLRKELKEFLICIKKNEEPHENIDRGVAVVKVLHYIEKSIEGNGKEYKIS